MAEEPNPPADEPTEGEGESEEEGQGEGTETDTGTTEGKTDVSATPDVASLQADLARERALRKFPAVPESLLTQVSGTPEEVEAYAQQLNDALQERTNGQSGGQQHVPPPAPISPGVEPVPTPVPGVGAAATPGDQNEARMDELTNKVLDKEATRSGTRLDSRAFASSEAGELYRLSLQKGFKELSESNRR